MIIRKIQYYLLFYSNELLKNENNWIYDVRIENPRKLIRFYEYRIKRSIIKSKTS